MQFLGHYGNVAWQHTTMYQNDINVFFNRICLDCILYKNSFNLSKNEKVTAVVHELLRQPSYINNDPELTFINCMARS